MSVTEIRDMNKTNIEFCDFTWNPVVGCLIGCWYCWARKFNYRFNKESEFTVPKFFPNRLQRPGLIRKPSKIFVCSMGDIFSPGVKDDWIRQILEVVQENPDHTFQFLTKRPQRYAEFDFPRNVWLGTSISTHHDFWRLMQLNLCGCSYVTFVLVEPIMSYMHGVDFSKIDFLFVGSLTGYPGTTTHNFEWASSIEHHNIIYKENFKSSIMAEESRLQGFFEKMTDKQLQVQYDHYTRILAEAKGKVPSKYPMPWMIEPWEKGLAAVNEIIERRKHESVHEDSVRV